LITGFPVSRAWYAHGVEPSPGRPTFELAGAGGTLVGFTAACVVLGALIGWAAGSAGIGLLIGAVVGIPVGIFAVYRRYGKAM
jgi:hypothetical protein